jgi:predicted metal-dependent hydrolase
MNKRTITIASEEVEIDIIRSSRRTIALYVRPGGTLLIRAPWYVPLYALMQFANQKTDWITRQRKKLKNVNPAAEVMIIENGSVIPFLGREITVTVKKGAVAETELCDGELIISLTGEASPEKITLLTERWYLREAKRRLVSRTSELAGMYSGMLPQPRSIGVRKMKRRWGTCHSNGDIWLNRELIKKEPGLIDYVIIHELCHLVHHNHGKEYYALLGSIIPGYPNLRKKLRQVY